MRGLLGIGIAVFLIAGTVRGEPRPVDVQVLSDAGQPDTFVAVSVLGSARTRSECSTCVAVSVLRDAHSGGMLAVGGRAASASAPGGVAVAGTWTASSPGVAVSALGSASGATPLALVGTCNGVPCFQLAAGGTGARAYWFALGTTGAEASPDGAAVTYAGPASGGFAASALGPARGDHASASVFGAATGPLGVSVLACGSKVSGLYCKRTSAPGGLFPLVP